MAESPKTMEVELAWKGKTGKLGALALAVEHDQWRDDRTDARWTADVLDRAAAFSAWLEGEQPPESMLIPLAKSFFEHLCETHLMPPGSYDLDVIVRQWLEDRPQAVSESEVDESDFEDEDAIVRPVDSHEVEHNHCGICDDKIWRLRGTKVSGPGKWYHHTGDEDENLYLDKQHQAVPRDEHLG